MGRSWKESDRVAIGLGLTLCFGFFLLLEGSCYLLNRSRYADIFQHSPGPIIRERKITNSPASHALPVSFDKLPQHEILPGNDDDKTDVLDYSLRYSPNIWMANGRMEPNSGYRSLVTASRSKEVIYDVKITSDAYGRRVTPGQERGSRDRHLLLLGCSFVLGEGVNDDAALGAVIASRAPGYRVYNFGEPGGSPSQMIARLQQGKNWEGVSEPSGTAVYVFFDGHVGRVIGNMSIVGSWGASFPFAHEYAPGVFRVDGSFKTERPFFTFFSWLFSLLETRKFFGIDIPWKFSDDDFAKFARIVQQLKTAYLTRFPGQKFVVAFYPGPPSSLAPDLIPHLERLGIDYLDYSAYNLLRFMEKRASHKNDGHPTAEANRIWGAVLARDLGLTR